MILSLPRIGMSPNILLGFVACDVAIYKDGTCANVRCEMLYYSLGSYFTQTLEDDTSMCNFWNGWKRMFQVKSCNGQVTMIV